MPKNRTYPVYVHLGLERTGTKYLQHTVLPALKGIFFVPRRQYWKMESFVPDSNDLPVVVSNEFDWMLDFEIKDFARRYPEAHPIFVLREHPSWLVSQFKRFVKNGGQLSFEEFFDPDSDQGRYEYKDMCFALKIHWLLKHFKHPPLILFYEDLKHNRKKYLDTLCAHIGAEYPDDLLGSKARHVSYSERELAFLLSFQRGPFGNFISRQKLLRYFLMFLARTFPFLAKKKPPLIPEGSLKRIQLKMSKDWEECLVLAEELNPKSIPENL